MKLVQFSYLAEAHAHGNKTKEIKLKLWWQQIYIFGFEYFLDFPMIIK